MGFGKTMLAVICGQLILSCVGCGLKEFADYQEKKNREREFEDKLDEIRYTVYGNRPKSDIPNARKVGFGENG